MYTEGALCDGTIISSAKATAGATVNVEIGKVDGEELTMTSAGFVRKKDLAAVTAILGDGQSSEGIVADESISTTDQSTEVIAAASNTRRRVQVDLRCGVSTEIDGVRPSENDVCVTVVSVSTPLACTPEVEKESLDALDRLGVFGFTKSKRKTAEQAQESALQAAEEKIRASAQKQAERHSKSAEQQKIRENEAFRAADLERKKRALGKVGKKKEKTKKKDEGAKKGKKKRSDIRPRRRRQMSKR